MTELSNLCGLAQVRAVKKSCHAALVFSQDVSRNLGYAMQMVGEVEASHGSLDMLHLEHNSILSKRISAPPILSLPPARPRDFDAEAVMPPTPDEVGDEAPKSLRVVGPPASAAPALTGQALDEHMEVSAEAGTLPRQIGLSMPSTLQVPQVVAMQPCLVLLHEQPMRVMMKL